MRYKQPDFLFAVFFICIITSVSNFAQSNVIHWSGFNTGFGSVSVSNNKITSAVGQTFIGQTQNNKNFIESGFLVDSLFFNPVTGIKESKEMPVSYELSQNYPNPFNPSTTIQYALPVASYVRLVLYNTIGQQIAVIVNSQENAGYHKVVFVASNLASGIYFYRLQANNYIQTRKLVLIK